MLVMTLSLNRNQAPTVIHDTNRERAKNRDKKTVDQSVINILGTRVITYISVKIIFSLIDCNLKNLQINFYCILYLKNQKL